jgi:hypothetical protein
MVSPSITNATFPVNKLETVNKRSNNKLSNFVVISFLHVSGKQIQFCLIGLFFNRESKNRHFQVRNKSAVYRVQIIDTNRTEITTLTKNQTNNLLPEAFFIN